MNFNDISNSDQSGFRVNDFRDCFFINNNVHDNDLDNFILDNVRNSSFIGKTAANSVALDGIGACDVRSSLFLNNYLVNNDDFGLHLACDSINNTIIYNYIDGGGSEEQFDGIRVEDGSVNNTIRDNSIVNNFDDPIDDNTGGNPNSSTDNTYINNKCDDTSEPAGLCDDVLP